MVNTVFQGVTVLTAVAALLFTALSLNATRDQLHLGEQGQNADRFSRAIDQLGQEGPDKLSIRLGGIYALEGVMRDSSADEPTVIEVLCAFVRTHAPFPNDVGATIDSGGRLSVSIEPSPPDVLAAVVVLGRRPHPEAEGNQRLDLSNTLLSMPGARLSRADLSGAELTGVYLSDADLSRANLSGAELSFANLTFADLSGANLTGTRQSSQQTAFRGRRLRLGDGHRPAKPLLAPINEHGWRPALDRPRDRQPVAR